MRQKKGAKRIKRRNEAAQRKWREESVSFSLWWWELGGGEVSVWEGTLGKSNRVFIAAGVCTCNKYCRNASRTSNNAILLLMTKTERTNIDIIHPCTICCQLQLQKKKSNEIETAKYCKNYWHGKKKVAFIEMGKWNKIKLDFLFFLPRLSVIGLSFTRLTWSRAVWWKARSVNVLGGKVGEKKRRAIGSQEKFEQWCKIGVGSANKAAFDLFYIYLFIHNSTVLGLDFQTDIEFVPEW